MGTGEMGNGEMEFRQIGTGEMGFWGNGHW